MRALLMAASLLTLSACTDDTSEALPEPPSAETPIPVEPDGGIGDGAGPPSVATQSTIPVRYHGVWDYLGGTCARESDLRLEIQADAITFYESFGEVQSVENVDPYAVSVKLSMSGEGDIWDQELGLRLVDGDSHLMVIDPEFPDQAEELIRKRCPQ